MEEEMAAELPKGAGVPYGGHGSKDRCTPDDGGRAGIECPNCGGQIDFHAGHIGNGRVFVCEKGRPPMREVRYYCRHCDSTVIFLRRCEPRGAGHD